MMNDCGVCQHCCIHMEISELNKPAGRPCDLLRRLDVPNACLSYGTRPQSCRAFDCMWRAIDGLPESHRPDKAGFSMWAGGGLLQVVEEREGAALRHPWAMKEILSGVKLGAVVRLYRPSGRHAEAYWQSGLKWRRISGTAAMTALTVGAT